MRLPKLKHEEVSTTVWFQDRL